MEKFGDPIEPEALAGRTIVSAHAVDERISSTPERYFQLELDDGSRVTVLGYTDTFSSSSDFELRRLAG